MQMVRRIKRGTYIHERSNWPEFRWDSERISQRLVEVRHRQGRLVGRMEGLGFQLRKEAVLNTLTEDVLKSSEIEGEKLDRDQVRSSIDHPNPWIQAYFHGERGRARLGGTHGA